MESIDWLEVLLEFIFWCFMWSFLLTILIRIKSSIKSRRKRVAFAVGILQVISTLCCISRMLLLVNLDSLRRKLTISTRTIRNYVERTFLSNVEDNINRWSKQVPDDLMLLILQRLSISDYFRCGAVCRSWRAAVNMAVSSKQCPPAPQLPLLMLCPHPLSLKDHCFLSLSHEIRDNYVPRNYSNLGRRLDCVGSIEGWLIMVDSVSCKFTKSRSSFDVVYYFLNPISSAKVMLRSSQSCSSLLPCKCRNRTSFYIRKAVASSVPTSQNCFVATLCLLGHLAFCRPTDRSWTLIEGEATRGLVFRDIAILNGKLYATSHDAFEFLMVFDILEDANGTNHSPSYRAQRLVMLQDHPSLSIPNLFRDAQTRNGITYVKNQEIIHLATDPTSMELFMIFSRIDCAFEARPAIPWREITGCEFRIPPKTKWFQVFKLKSDINDPDPRWEEVVDLGDRILFLSNSGNVFIRTSSGALDYDPGYKTLQRNCIYFAFDYFCLRSPSSGHDFGVFSMKDKSFKHLTFSKSYYGTLLHTRPIWFTPNPW